MKTLKALVIVTFFLFFVQSTATVYAWPNLIIPTIRIPNLNLVIPTVTPTPTPFPTVTPVPTVIPPPPPIDTPIQEAVVQDSQGEKIPTISLTVVPTQTSLENKSTSQKDLIYGGIVGLLALVILIQAWPGIKKIIHEKTA